MSLKEKRSKSVEAPEHKSDATFFAAQEPSQRAANTEAQAPEASPTVHADSSVNTQGSAQRGSNTFLSVTAGQGAHSADPLARFGPMVPLSTHRPTAPTAEQIEERVKRKAEQERRAFAGMGLFPLR